MQIIINNIEIETIETTPVQSKVKTYEQGEGSTIHFTAYKEGVKLTGTVECVNPAFDEALDGLRKVIAQEIKKHFMSEE